MQIELSISGLSVMIAIPVNRDFPWQTNMALVQTVCALKDRNIPFDYQLVAGGSLIDKARSELAHKFLKSEMNRLFWIDSDIAWKPEAFLRVLALTSKMPIVGAAYCAKRGPNTEFMLSIDGNRLEANEWGCLQIGGMGLGFTCVAREVIEQLAEGAKRVRNDMGERVAMIFRTGVEGDAYVGEDMNFFRDAAKLGYDCNVDPQIELGHVGGNEYRGRLRDALTLTKAEYLG